METLQLERRREGGKAQGTCGELGWRLGREPAAKVRHSHQGEPAPSGQEPMEGPWVVTGWLGQGCC